MNTQEPHPKERPALSEGQRRVLELLEPEGRYLVDWFGAYSQVHSANGRHEAHVDPEAVGMCYQHGYITPYEVRSRTELYRITSAGRAALGNSGTKGESNER